MVSLQCKHIITFVPFLLKIWIDFFTLHVILSFRHTKITMTDIKKVKIMIMQKDALNNVNISEELVLITPEELKQNTR